MFNCEVYCWDQKESIENWVHIYLLALTESEAIKDAKAILERDFYDVREMKEVESITLKYYCSFYCWDGTKADWRKKQEKKPIRIWLYANSEKDAIQRARAISDRENCELQKLEVL
jgi:hypothetical protein